MKKDVYYINGMIAVKEKSLLGDRIFRMCELTSEEAFRLLVESGFGGGEEAEGADFEKLLRREEQTLDDFINECSPGAAERAYLMAPRDFHNAKAMMKALLLDVDPAPMLAPEGESTYESLKNAVYGDGDEGVAPEIIQAVSSLKAIGEERELNGAEVGAAFEKALYAYLARSVKHHADLKDMVAKKADMVNILTALRSADYAEAERAFVPAGKLDFRSLELLFGGDEGAIEERFGKAGYGEFTQLCLAYKGSFSEAERKLASLETDELKKNAYELKSRQPFLYYVFRRRAEIANVRIILVCLSAGMDERAIKARLRTS